MAAIFESKLIDVVKGTDSTLARAAEVVGGMMESKAKEYVTEAVYTNDSLGWYIRTGNLRNSIAHAVEQDENGTAAVVGSTAGYSMYVELGTGIHAEGGGGRQTPWKYQDAKGNWHTTSGMPSRPFLRPALENHIKEYQETVEAILRDMP